jgi:hypothetical protein
MLIDIIKRRAASISLPLRSTGSLKCEIKYKSQATETIVDPVLAYGLPKI